MKQTYRITITTTHRRTLRARPVCAPVYALCPMCGREVETLAPSQATDVLEVSQPALSVLLTAGLIHALPTVSGGLRICCDSLFGQSTASGSELVG